MMSKPTHSKPSAKHTSTSNAKAAGRQPIDPLLAQRLEQLNTRRPGSPLPPPASPGTAGASPTRTATQGSNASQQQKLAAAAAKAQAARAGAKPVGRRAKPARRAKAASLAMSVVTTAGLAAMFANNQPSTDSVILTGGTVATADSTVAAPTTTVLAAAGAATTAVADTSTTAATTPAVVANTIVDGTYVGGASQNRFGVVQVQAVYSGGQLADVQILSYPNGDNRSVRINQYAIPMLISDSITAQGANINGVSGATYTSRSYVASLQSAIDAAKAASGITG
jgi:uncharacterized protein with FMN-binding domain